MDDKFDEIVNHMKIYGYIYPGSQIYGGLSNSWDYGPLGSLLKNNIKNHWINTYVKKSTNSVLIDSGILLNSKVWEASGHINKFSDPLIDCRDCKNRFRADDLIESQLKIKILSHEIDELNKETKKLFCPICQKKNFTEIRDFNLMFKTYQGVVEGSKKPIYLRPETAQGIFVNFKNVQRSMRLKLPFGIAQIGKAFRNEITPSKFIFRTREFEQMEYEYFINPKNNDLIYDEQITKSIDFIKSLGVNSAFIRLSKTNKDSLAHYALANSDIEYKFPFGWGEIAGISQRGDYDLISHQKHSKENLSYFDTKTNDKIVPFVIEPTFGLSRLVLTVLVDSYKKVITNNNERVFLDLSYKLAPYKIAILPLVNKLKDESFKLFEDLSNDLHIVFDSSGSIGKRYVRQDLIGTPFCITFDYDSLNDNKVTIRNRNTTIQKRVLIKDIKEFVENYEWE